MSIVTVNPVSINLIISSVICLVNFGGFDRFRWFWSAVSQVFVFSLGDQVLGLKDQTLLTLVAMR